MITFFKLLSNGPLWLLHGAGVAMGWLVFLVSSVYRNRFLSNARQARLGWRQWAHAVGESGKLVAELPRLWLGRPVQVLWDGAAHVEAALALGRGVVFLESGTQGSVGRTLSTSEEQALMAGLSVAEVVLPKASPQTVSQLGLWQ